MVEITAAELTVYTTVLAIGYASHNNSPVFGEFMFPVGKVMLFIKDCAESAQTHAELHRTVLNKAVTIANGEGLL